MKKLFFIFFLGCILRFSFAQNQMHIMSNERTAGRNFLTNTEVRAKEWVFPKNIQSFYFDTATNCFTIQMGGLSPNDVSVATGKISVYDLSKDSLKWAKNFNYNTNSLLQSGNIIIQARSDAAFRLNSETGKKQWRINAQLFYVDDYSDVGLGYSPSTETSHMEGFRLSDGKPVWERKVSREYGWNNITHIDDSVILLVAAGLHIIDLRNGSGWDYETVTGSKDYTGTVAANAAGLLLGALTGYYSVYSGYDLVSDICSNVWFDSAGYYFASREKIARLDDKLNPQWTSELPKKKASKSEIFIQDSLIYMINHGYAIKGARTIYFGNPFFAAFNKDNGQQVFFNEISDKKEIISDFITGNNMVICLSGDKISAYSMQDGFLNVECRIDTKKYGKLKSFSTNEYFIESDTGFYPIDVLNPYELFVSTDSSMIISLNDQYEITGTFNQKDFYRLYHSANDLQFLWKDDETIVVTADHRKIGVLDASPRSVYINKKLYDIQQRKFIEYGF